MVAELAGPTLSAAAANCIGTRRFEALPAEGSSNSSSNNSTSGSEAALVIPLRVFMVGLATGASVLFPHFGLIVAIIGSFSVTLVSFVLPSAMCLLCARDEKGVAAAIGRPWLGKTFSGFEADKGSLQWWCDAGSLALGLVACVGATFITVTSVH
jgi:hypothetical protein